MSQLPLPTSDPFTGDELVVTRLRCPANGNVFEGEFSLGWIGRLTPEQLEFVGLLLRNRNNLQRVAQLLDVAYNTARSRLDDVVQAVGGDTDAEPAARQRVLERLAAGEISVEDARREIAPA